MEQRAGSRGPPQWCYRIAEGSHERKLASREFTSMGMAGFHGFHG
jgi:hypothetical protein